MAHSLKVGARRCADPTRFTPKRFYAAKQSVSRDTSRYTLPMCR